MAGSDECSAFFNFENLLDIIGIATHGFQEGILTGSIVVSHRSFYQVTGTVEFMAIPVLESLVLLSYQVVAVKIAVFITVADNVLHSFVYQSFQCGIALVTEQVGDTLDPLCNIRIPIDVRHIGVSIFPLAFQRVKSVSFLKTVIDRMYSGVFDKILFFFPKSTVNHYVGKGNKCHVGTTFLVIC